MVFTTKKCCFSTQCVFKFFPKKFLKVASVENTKFEEMTLRHKKLKFKHELFLF